MDYGTDFLLVDDAIVFTLDGDVELEAGPACVAQDITQRLNITAGVLPWDKEGEVPCCCFSMTQDPTIPHLVRNWNE
jgi:hypothetical protein